MVRDTPPIPSSAINPSSAPPPPPTALAAPIKPLPSRQLELYELDIIRQMPPSGGADSAFIGTGRDGMKYNIKTVSKTPAVPGAEWFCQHLAELIGIAAAHPTILRLPGETAPAYGSRWERGMLSQGRNGEILTGKLLAERLSALYAMDTFVHNVDRHHGNYVFVEIDGLYRLIAMDFSRAWTYHGWPPPALPMSGHSNTVAQGRIVRKHFAFDMAAAEQALAAIEKVTLDHVQGIFNRMPGQWLDDIKRAGIARWWTDGSMVQRCAAIRKGLSDGTYL